ncbi:MAG TPA: hypothetical protein VGD08_00705 [Stellaceae bacterium]
MSRIAVAMVAVAAALSLAACQPLPQPFKDDRPPPGAPILKLKDGAGIQVGAISGVDDAVAARLAEAMAEALRQADVPASTQARNRASYILTAAAATQPSAAPGRTAIEVKWTLAAPDGKTAGDYMQRLEAAAEPWRAGDPALMTTMARAGAPQIATLLQDEPTGPAQPVAMPRMTVLKVAGAPGDGSTMLTRAMESALRRAQVDVGGGGSSDGGTPSPAGLVLAGKVDVGPPKNGAQHVQIVWAVQRDGKEIGRINQENDVPAGTLDRGWGDIAFIVADAALPGIMALLERTTGPDGAAPKDAAG